MHISVFIILIGVVAFPNSQTQALGVVNEFDGIIGKFTNDQIGGGGGYSGVYELPSGNIVIHSPYWNNGHGAVTCLTRAEFELGNIVISEQNSLIGMLWADTHLVVLSNGNYVVASPYWGNNNGVVTWVNGTTCIPANETTRNATVSAQNSLIGSMADDQVGINVVALPNGNYLVVSQKWHENRGAVTWGNGMTGIVGEVSSANSLVGTFPNDYVGGDSSGSYGEIVILTNGNYVVRASEWHGARGAVVWGNGTTGISGEVSSSNALVGTKVGDRVGGGLGGSFRVYAGVTPLTNGHYVVTSPYWDNGSVLDVGAATWGNGNGGTVGAISDINSLIGVNANDRVGYDNATALTNGNYVVNSWMAGYVTWCNGATGRVGQVSIANSLSGYLNGWRGVVALPNGNYVVKSRYYSTWGNGTTGTTGDVVDAQTLTGIQDDNYRVLVLTNGNYLVIDQRWDNGGLTTDVGAITWVNGLAGFDGAQGVGNSLTGTSKNDLIGDIAVALTNGGFVIGSSGWDDGATVNVGAVTWGDGLTPLSGTISSANSLIGVTAHDQLGYVDALPNGNYLIRAPYWDNGGVVDAGAVIWSNGATGRTGAINTSIALYGSSANDRVGIEKAFILTNGNFVIPSPYWNNGAVGDAGAVTWGSATSGVVGQVSGINSLYGSNVNQSFGGWNPQYGYKDIVALPNGNYVIRALSNRAGGSAEGTVTLANGMGGTVGAVSATNSYIGLNATYNDISDLHITPLADSNFVFGVATWDTATVSHAGFVSFGTPNPTTNVQKVIDEQSLYNAIVPSLVTDMNTVIPDIHAGGISATIGFSDNAVATVELTIVNSNGLLIISIASLTFQQGYSVEHETHIYQEFVPLVQGAFNALLGNYQRLRSVSLTDQSLLFTLRP